MARLILVLLAIAAVFAALASAIMFARQTRDALSDSRELTMPMGVQTVAYILLITLMLGVTTGWLGAA
jgi:uncharacterized membrane protein